MAQGWRETVEGEKYLRKQEWQDSLKVKEQRKGELSMTGPDRFSYWTEDGSTH